MYVLTVSGRSSVDKQQINYYLIFTRCEKNESLHLESHRVSFFLTYSCFKQESKIITDMSNIKCNINTKKMITISGANYKPILCAML